MLWEGRAVGIHLHQPAVAAGEDVDVWFGKLDCCGFVAASARLDVKCSAGRSPRRVRPVPPLRDDANGAGRGAAKA